MSVIRKKPNILNRSRNKDGVDELTVNDTNVDEMTENPWQVDSIQARSIKKGVLDPDTLFYKQTRTASPNKKAILTGFILTPKSAL